MCCGVNKLYITPIYKHVQQIMVCSLGIHAMHTMDSCLHKQLSIITPYMPQYSGIWEVSTLIGHLHLLINYNKWKIAFSWAWPPGMNLWTTAHDPVYMWALAAAAAFCPKNKPPCVFNLFMMSTTNWHTPRLLIACDHVKAWANWSTGLTGRWAHYELLCLTPGTGVCRMFITYSGSTVCNWIPFEWWQIS